MKRTVAFLQASARTRTGVAILAVVVLVSLAVAFRPRKTVEPERDPEQRLFVKVKRAMTGQKIKLDNDTEEYLVYAGIRAPQNDEPLQEESTRRNEELIAQKEVRLRFDDEHRDGDGRLLAYVFDGDQFVNETLVREGLAYVRLTTAGQRFGQRLLAAQAEARKKGRGIWAKRSPSRESSYPADPKYGNFHRPSCEEASKINPERLVTFKSDKEALEKGFAPCSKCKP
jgi:micrococcal nuclease